MAKEGVQFWEKVNVKAIIVNLLVRKQQLSRRTLVRDPP